MVMMVVVVVVVLVVGVGAVKPTALRCARRHPGHQWNAPLAWPEPRQLPTGGGLELLHVHWSGHPQELLTLGVSSLLQAVEQSPPLGGNLSLTLGSQEPQRA